MAEIDGGGEEKKTKALTMRGKASFSNRGRLPGQTRLAAGERIHKPDAESTKKKTKHKKKQIMEGKKTLR